MSSWRSAPVGSPFGSPTETTTRRPTNNPLRSGNGVQEEFPNLFTNPPGPNGPDYITLSDPRGRSLELDEALSCWEIDDGADETNYELATMAGPRYDGVYLVVLRKLS